MVKLIDVIEQCDDGKIRERDNDVRGVTMHMFGVPGVFDALRSCGYDGWVSIEIETGDHDPSAEIIASAETVREVLESR